MISSNCQNLSDSVKLTPRQKRSIPLILAARKHRGGLRDGRDYPADMVRLDEG